jgi:HD-GYP domain-containing protein (c-di-GMP phosphodiesterase class II)
MDSIKPTSQLLQGAGRALSLALAERDRYTGGHCDRVLALAVELGARLDFSWRELELLALSARFHDLGKIGIPDYILHKPGTLDDEEWNCMQRHAEIGERIVRGIGCEHADEVARAVRHHHEYFDGSGYPDGLSGTSIPLFARVIALIDNYDATAFDRPYRNSMPHGEVMELLHSEVGSKHDPDLLHAFTALIEKPEIRQQLQ